MFDKIADELVSILKVDKSRITMDTDIMAELHVDSITIVELLYNLECEYGITIDDDAVAGFKTVGDVVRYVEKAVK